MPQKKKQILACILVFIFALYYANVSFFYHSHIINGFAISHSHFHNTEHPKTGTHTAGEISLIAALSAFQSLQAALCLTGIGLFFLAAVIFRIGSERKPASVTPSHSYLRAPPTSF